MRTSRADVQKSRRTLVRAGGATLSFSRVAESGAVNIRVLPGLPATTPRLRSAWPVAHFVIDFTGRLEPHGSATIDLDVRTLGFDPRDKSVRLLEWDGKAYHDITTHLDKRSGHIRGATTALRTYVVAKITSAPASGR